MHGVRVPSKSTLRKYGLTPESYRALVANQQGLCGVCSEPLADRKTVIEHYHRRGWKKLPPDERVRYVRSIAHCFCNRYVIGRLSRVRAGQAHAYLERFKHLETT